MLTFTLQELPEEIILQIIGYLPQQAKLNLLYTNYHFYTLVQKKLYENIMFSISPALKDPNSFQESQYTVVGGVDSPLATTSLNQRIYESRQEILLDAIMVNKELCGHIKRVAIVGEYDCNGKISSVSEAMNPQLLSYLIENCQSLKKVSCYNLVFPNIISQTFDCVQLSSLEHIKKLNFKTLKSLEFSLIEGDHNLDVCTDDEFVSLLANLKTLAFHNEISQGLVLKKIQKIDTFHFSRLEDLKLLYYHNFDDPYKDISMFLETINFQKLKSLELIIGCNDITCDCITRFTDYLIKKNINVRKLAFIQRTIHRDHNYTEAFDMHITEFLKNLPNVSNLKELYIYHTPPDDFNVDCGFEGNYLHRKSLYEAILPLLNGLEILNCPSFMQSLACYEQLISDLLWNGCKCQHCDDYLPIFDKYILNHKYYDEAKSRLTDMISPVLFGNAAMVLSRRGNTQRLIEWPFYPLLDKFWNFHSAPYQITHMSDCLIDQSAFNPLTKCIVHFLQQYVEAVGTMIPHLKRCVFSGLSFDRHGDTWYCTES